MYVSQRDRAIYVVQSKWINSGNGAPDLGSVEKFIRGIEDLLTPQFERFNTKLLARQAEITQPLNDPDWTLKAVVVYTGSSKLSSHATSVLTQLLETINDTSDYLEIITLAQKDLYAALVSGISGKPITLDVGLRAWGRTDRPYTAFYGQVNAAEIAQWWQDHRLALFAKNLRGVLGETEVNKEIRETLENSPESFWYFNNGITIIAKRIVKTLARGADTEHGTFHCEDLSVVNGAQTVATIGRFAESSKKPIDKAFVPIRLVSLENTPETFGDLVTKTNNRQNRIEIRDFVSLDQEQLRIKTELAVDGIDYQVLRSEGFKSSATSFDLVESTTALACATGDPELAVHLKREISKLWDDIKKPPYTRLFNDKVTGPYVWQCVQLQRKIDARLEALGATESVAKNKSILIWGNRIISSIAFKTIDTTSFQRKGFELDNFLKNPALDAFITAAAAALIARVGADYPNSYIATLFKNPTKSKDLHAQSFKALAPQTATVAEAIASSA